MIIDVTLSELASAKKKLNTEVLMYKAQVTLVKNAAANLCGKWEGDAKTGFAIEQAQAVSFYQNMAKRVNDAANKLAKAANEYDAAEQECRDYFKNI